MPARVGVFVLGFTPFAILFGNHLIACLVFAAIWGLVSLTVSPAPAGRRR